MHHSVLTIILILVILPGSRSGNCECETDCCSSNCVSSEMEVEELTKGIVSVSELSAGDIIRGLREPEKTQDWCKVDAVYLRETIQNFTTYNGFTEDHMVIDGDTVRPHGQKGEAVDTQLYTLATECDAAINAAGQAFTPISTTFCPMN